MSTTRLLVLGIVRFMQPVHGYDVRRELVSWRVENWTNVKPGSVYSALRTMTRDGLLAVKDVEQAAGRPERTTYVLTTEGEKEFQILLREAWWRVEPSKEPLIPALCLMLAMPRSELAAAMGSRVAQLEGQQQELAFVRASIKDGATGADGDIPEHVRVVLDFVLGKTRAELEWTRGFLKQLKAGSYSFADESPGRLSVVAQERLKSYGRNSQD